MVNRRFQLPGLFAVLLALMAQLGSGAVVPRIDPIAIAGVLCHTDGDAGGTPSHAPGHPADCPICPLCAAFHAAPVALVSPGTMLTPPGAVVVRKAELPPPATAPPTTLRPPVQPRAPPIFS